MLVIEKFEGHHVKVAGEAKPKLNMVTFDFLGMSQRQELKVRCGERSNGSGGGGGSSANCRQIPSPHRSAAGTHRHRHPPTTRHD